MLGQRDFIANEIAFVPASLGHVVVVGKSGLWASGDGAVNWYPMVRGLGVTVARSVAADPNSAGRAYAALADWDLLQSADGLAHVTNAPPGNASFGQSLALDTAVAPAMVYFGAGDPNTNTNGDLWSDPDPASGTPWTSEGLGAVTGGKRVMGVAVQRVSGSPVVLAAVEQGGVWRKAGGSWTQVSSQAMVAAQKSRSAPFAWAPGSSTVYLYDHQTGVWRSADNGSTWTLIWQKPSPYDMSGYLAIDPQAPASLYVSVALNGVYRLDNANKGAVGSGITPVTVGSFASPGAIEFGPDRALYVATVALPAVPPRLSRSLDLGKTWADIDDSTYRATAVFPTALAIGSHGELYVSTRGDGVVVGTPVS